MDFQGRGANGTFISNSVSRGQDETDLYLTFYFEYRFPDIQEGSEDEKKTAKPLWGMARQVVQETIDVGRKMVKNNEIKL